MVFVVGSVLCGLSQTVSHAASLSRLQGVGAGAFPSRLRAWPLVVPLRDRGRYQGVLGAVFGVAYGHRSANRAGCRLSELAVGVWINVPVSIAVLTVAAPSWPDRPNRSSAGILVIAVATTADHGHQVGAEPPTPWAQRPLSGC